MEALQAAPEQDRAGLAVALAGQEAAQLRDPTHRLADRGRRGWGRGALMYLSEWRLVKTSIF